MNRRSSVDNSSCEIPKLEDDSVVSGHMVASFNPGKAKRSRSPVRRVSNLDEASSLSYSIIDFPQKSKPRSSREKRILSELIGWILMCLVDIKEELTKYEDFNLILNKDFEIDIYDIMIRLNNSYGDQLHIRLSVDGYKTVFEKVSHSLKSSLSDEDYKSYLIKFVGILLPTLPYEVQYDIVK